MLLLNNLISVKELKSNFLFDNKMKNSELEKIKEVVESNTIRKRKKVMIIFLELIIS